VSAAEITALCTGLPAVIAAFTGLVVALRSRVTANTTQKLLTAHIIKARDAGIIKARDAGGPAARLKSGQ
jgi:hypothetical protein